MKKISGSTAHAKLTVDRLLSSMSPMKKYIQVIECGEKKSLIITRRGVGFLKTAYGSFWHYDFGINDEWFKYSVLYKGDVDEQFNPIVSKEKVIVRIDSGCETGQIFGDRTCDCKEQLQKMMKEIHHAGGGFVIHIPRQDGRGQGLPFKLTTLLFQHYFGMDTIEAARAVAHDKCLDVRTYAGVVGLLKFIGIGAGTQIDLATGNPMKERVFTDNNYTTKSKEVWIRPTKDTWKHLKAKKNAINI